MKTIFSVETEGEANLIIDKVIAIGLTKELIALSFKVAADNTKSVKIRERAITVLYFLGVNDPMVHRLLGKIYFP